MKHHQPRTGTIATDQALTGSYADIGSVDVAEPKNNYIQSGAGRDQIVLLLDYTNGDETSCEIKILFSDTIAFTDAYQDVVTTTSSGESTIYARNYTMTATGKYRLLVPSAGLYWKIQTKATGGTPTGTLSLSYRMDVIDK